MTGSRGHNSGADAEKAVRMAATDLTRRLRVKRADIALKEVVPQTWQDASLGCPEPEMVYAQVITTGFTVILICNEISYEYRTDAKTTLVFVGETSD